MQLVFATNNSYKIKEVKSMLPPTIKLLGLVDIGCFDELPENGNTILSNAYQKGRYIHDKYGVNCFADDTGLEVLALNGRPGVHSARFAGSDASSAENVSKLLNELNGIKSRDAVFRTVIALFIKDKEFFFEGEIKGIISEAPAGEDGFGYDSVFIPEGHNKTFSEMKAQEKNEISHRRIAIDKLVVFLSGEIF